MTEKIPLEENKEFKSIRNEVVKIASDLKISFDFYGQDDSEPSDETEEEDLEDLEYWSEQGDETQMYLLGKKYLDEYDDPEEAEHWLKKASENGNEYAMYLLYKCYRDGRIEDKENEKMKYLKMALNKGYDDVTTIMIASRVSSIANCTEIIVLEEGKVIGQGTHEELLKTCDTYREIAETQMGGM